MRTLSSVKCPILIACLASAAAGSCATPRQYVYNCTLATITFDGTPIATRSFESRPGSRTQANNAILADGSVLAPLRVPSSQVDSFGHANTWISPANVCRQFGSQVVIVDLR